MTKTAKTATAAWDQDWSWAQVADLWAQIYGEPPPITCEPAELIAVLVAHLPAPAPYRPDLLARQAAPLDNPVEPKVTPWDSRRRRSSR